MKILERDANLFIAESDKLVVTVGVVWIIARVTRRVERSRLMTDRTSVRERALSQCRRSAWYRVVYKHRPTCTATQSHWLTVT